MPGVSRPGVTGRISSINTTPVAMYNSGANFVVNEGIVVVTPSTNVENIWVGYSPNITADSADATDGFPIAPGASLFIPCRTPAELYVRSTAGSNLKLWFIGA